MFNCKRCGFETNHKHVLLRHLQRKVICDPVFEDIDVTVLLSEFDNPRKIHGCKYCDRKFTDYSNRSKHQKICMKKHDIPSVECYYQQIVDDDKTRTECENGRTDHHNSDIDRNKDEVIEDLKEKLALAERQIEHLKQQKIIHEGTQTTTVFGDVNNVTTTINQNNYVVVMNNFGCEDVSHVIQDKKFLDECISKLQTGIPDVVSKIYYDESKPENKTVVLKSAKRKTALVHTGDGKWEEKDMNQVVPLMVRKGSRILSNHLRNKNVAIDDIDDQEVDLAKQGYITCVITQKKPEYDMVSSAVKASIFNHR